MSSFPTVSDEKRILLYSADREPFIQEIGR